ncbi:hypothetical protein [Nostoc sp.]|uniref:hypothetical protein n=1 Tax=Nostoc sp. TaxID=1180 RepID=UPI002FFA4046
MHLLFRRTHLLFRRVHNAFYETTRIETYAGHTCVYTVVVGPERHGLVIRLWKKLLPSLSSTLSIFFATRSLKLKPL